jgi:hypothetical protein
VAAEEEEPYFPPPPEDPPVVDLPELAALPVLESPLQAEDSPSPPLPPLTSTTASTSVRAPTASVLSSALFIVLSLIPLEAFMNSVRNGLGMRET